MLAFFETFAPGVEHCDGGAVDNALRPDVHVGAGCHLAVLRYAHSVEAFPVIGFGIVGDHHAVCDDDARSVGVGGEKTERMAGIHHQCLRVGHLREIFHSEQILCPVLENGTVAAVGDQFVGMLGHPRIEIVLDHHHDRGGLT